MRFRLAPLALVALVACGDDGGEPPADPGSALGGAPQSGAAVGPWFRDATADSGIDFVHEAGATAEKHLPETMGAGAALFDADGDGRLDVYFVQGGPIPGAEGPAPQANRLYLGTGAGRFRDATLESGDGAHTGYGMGVVAGDLDGDGRRDLYVTNFGPDAYLWADGPGRFVEATAESGLGDARWNAGAVLFDADLDGDLDLYVTAYVAVDVANPAYCGDRREGWRSYCHPDHYEGLADRYWRNQGGTFVDATAEAGLSDNLGKGLGAIAGDLDEDGDLDLYVANDSVENKFWRNRGDGTFEDDTLFTGTGVNRNGASEAGMGLALGDTDGDGDFDLFVTNFDDESNTLYRNQGDGLFVDATIPSGLDAPSRLPVGFGCVLEDFDLDGYLDLVVANGHIIDNIHLYHDGKTWRQRAQLFVGGDGPFRERRDLAGPLEMARVGRGLVSGDLDGDGDPDLILTACGGPAVVLENVAARNSGRVVRGLAPGTRVEARGPDGRLWVRQLGAAVSYCGQGEEAVFLPPSATGIRVREPGAEPRAWHGD